MYKEQQQKRTFIYSSLLDLVTRINKKIVNINYIIKIPNIEEYVIIQFRDNDNEIKINITKNNLKEITLKILKEI